MVVRVSVEPVVVPCQNRSHHRTPATAPEENTDDLVTTSPDLGDY